MRPKKIRLSNIGRLSGILCLCVATPLVFFAGGSPPCIAQEQMPPQEPVSVQAEVLEATSSSTAADEFKKDSVNYRAQTKDLGPPGQVVIDSLDLIDADLGNVLRAVGKIANLNIIAGEEVKGKVTVYWRKVTVQQALDSILSTNNYGYVYEGNVLKVLTAKKLGEDKTTTLTRVFLLQYLRAEEMQKAIEQMMGSSSSGSSGSSGSAGATGQSSRLKIGFQKEANALMVTGIPREVEEIERVILMMDRATKQVRIESRILEISLKEDSNTGMDWTLAKNEGQSTMKGLFALGAGALTAGSFRFGFVNDPYTLTGLLQAEYGQNRVKVLANPNILALDNQEANIEITNQLPYVTSTVSQGVITQSINYQPTGITLKVTPRITDDGHVRMHVKPTQRVPGPTIILQNSTAFNVDERTAETDLLVKDGATVVIGGLRSNDQQKTLKKVPILGDLPGIGRAFQHVVVNDRQVELVVFVTPHIVKQDEANPLSADEILELKRSEDITPRLREIRKEEDEKKLRAESPVFPETQQPVKSN